VVEEGKVVGIVTRANLLHALAGIADEIAPSSAGDTAIREQIFAEMKGTGRPGRPCGTGSFS
jgi:hypothetical protein